MTTPETARVFISYAVRDGSEAAAELRRDLESRDQSLYSVWQDLIRLEGGRDWWSQIEAAIRHPVLQHLVLIVTPTALTRPVIREELRLARRLGKTVVPVRGPGLGDLAKLPRWLGQVLDLAKPEHKVTFLRQLAGPSQHNPVPLWPPAPPVDFVPRLQHMTAIVADLLDAESHDAIAITAALRGTTVSGASGPPTNIIFDMGVWRSLDGDRLDDYFATKGRPFVAGRASESRTFGGSGRADRAAELAR